MFKDPEKKRQYFKDYMRRRRADLRTVLNPESERAKFNPNRPHQHSSIKIAGVWHRVAEQDGNLFDRDSGELVQIE